MRTRNFLLLKQASYFFERGRVTDARRLANHYVSGLQLSVQSFHGPPQLRKYLYRGVNPSLRQGFSSAA